MGRLDEAAAYVAGFVDGHTNSQAAYLLCAVVVGILSVLYLTRWYRQHIKAAKLMRRRAMTHPQREKYINEAIGDLIEDAILTLESRDDISREEARTMRKRFANVLTLPDLLPRGTRALKDRIKRTKYQGGVAGPVGKLPKPEDIVVPPKTWSFGQNFLRRTSQS